MALVLKVAAYICSLLICGWAAFAALSPLSRQGMKRLSRIFFAVAALLIVVALASVSMDINRIFGQSTVPAVGDVLLYLNVTNLGRSWAWRIGLTALAAIALLVFPHRRWAWATAAALGAGALVPAAIVSHAAIAAEYPALFVTLHWVHLFSISVWFAGLLTVALRGVVDPEDTKGFIAVFSRFSTAAMVAVPIAVATGAFQMQNTLDEANDLVAFTYGQALLAKHLFLLPVLILAGYHFLVLKPRLVVTRTKGLIKRARQNVVAEWLLVLGMLVSTAVFAREVPPSHIGWAGPDHLLALDIEFGAVFVVWSVVALAAVSLLVATLRRGAAWPLSTLMGAGFALAVFAAVTSQVVVLDQEVFRHSSDPEVVARGAELYATNCAICHGESGRGDGPLAIGLTPPPADLTARHVYHHSDERVLRWITDGIRGSAMPPFGEYLTLEERQAIVSFIRQLSIEAASGAR